jgi:hypothetical protein
MAKQKFPVHAPLPRIVSHPRLLGWRLHFVPVSSQDPRFLASLRRHYTKSAKAPYGKKQVWEIYEEDGESIALVGYLGLGEPIFRLAVRARVGRRPDDRANTASNFIYRLEGPRVSLASDILKAWIPVAQADWKARYGEELIHIESLIGQGEPGNPGASFKAAGFRTLGMTSGRTARRPAHGKKVWSNTTPKLVLYWGPLARVPVQ